MVSHIHQGAIQPAAKCFRTLYRWRQLAVVTCKDNTMCLADSNPAGSFQRLCGLVDEQRAELHACQQKVGRPYQRAGYHFGIIEKRLLDSEFYLACAVFEACNLLVPVLGVSAARGIQLAYGATYGPQFLI